MTDYSLPPTIYEGANYTLQPSYNFQGDSNSPYLTGAFTPAGKFSAPSDPRTANQIDAVSKKISTGLRNIEVSGVNITGGGAMGLIDDIPKQHFKEINRLKKLAGVELTFHGPLVEPTGIGRDRWDEQQRIQAEREMTSAVERAHDLDPDGNIIVTFHASNGLPEPRTIVKDSKGNVVSEKIYVIDENTGNVAAIPKRGINYYEGGKTYSPDDDLAKYNKIQWSQSLNQIAIETERASRAIHEIEQSLAPLKGESQEDKMKQALEVYNAATSDRTTKDYEDYLETMGPGKDRVKSAVLGFTFARANAEDAYLNLQETFNKAMGVADRDNNNKMKEQLESFRKEIAPKLKEYDKDPEQLQSFVDEIGKGVRLLQSITRDSPPQTYRPLEEFAIDKASTTFANVALTGYKKFTSTAPIVSIENPPVGMGLSKSEELSKLVDESRKKFVKEATLSTKDGGLGMSESAAKKEAEKLIGVTWDVGHINMLRKYGFDEKDLVKQTENIGKYVKHIHLSDNFGLEHTELPMGMGNVPVKAELAAIEKKLGKEYFSKVKQVIETGGWFRNFNNVTPFAETLEAFGSPIYGMKMAPYWNRTRGTGAGYFTGYGKILPDVHFSTYGAGFPSLPLELGGQMAGRSRLSGTPTE